VRRAPGGLLHARRALHARGAVGGQRLHRDYPTPAEPLPPSGRRADRGQARGKALFERTRTNDGRTIPVDNRCVTCHFPPLYTDRSIRDVGTKMASDRQGRFDVPHLNNIYDSAPYLHNGMADTLEEIWTRFNPYDTHGVTTT